MVTIIYTSGTSGEPKGVCLNVANVTYMLSCTTQRLNQLMGTNAATVSGQQPDRIFHYLPFNFCASWIALLSFLSRDSTITLSTDLNRLVDEIALASPHYFLNVPTLLERVKRGVDAAFAQRHAAIQWLFARARAAWQRKRLGTATLPDSVYLALGRRLIFSKIKARFGAHLRALICGSAPLTQETQEFFEMLQIPVLQVYGLTETTGICTMDDPRAPGRAWLRRPRHPRPRNESRRERRNRRARPECFPRLLESPGRNRARRAAAAGFTPAIRARPTLAATGASADG